MVEAIGGKNNLNIVPVMILQFNEEKLNEKGVLPKNVQINAKNELDLAYILNHSIEINQIVREGNSDVPFYRVLLGISGTNVADKIEYYAIRFIIQERINQAPLLAEAKLLGKLYAVNAKK